MNKVLSIFMILFCLTVENGYATVVSGRVIERSGVNGIINGAIYFSDLRNEDKQYICLTDEEGFYVIDMPSGDYRVSLAYQKEHVVLIDNVAISGEQQYLGVHFIDIEGLDAAVITAEKPLVKYRKGLTLYDLSSIKAVEGGSALDGIRYLPGINIDGNGELKLNGFESPTIRINGRDLGLSSNETISYLSGIKVESVKTVEYIRNPGPEFDSNGTPVLNIVLKNETDNFEGASSASVVFRRLFSETFSVRLDLNKSKFSNYVFYSMKHNRRRTVYTLNAIQNDTSRIVPSIAHNLNIGSDLKLSKKDTVGCRLYGSLFSSRQKSSGSLFINNFDSKSLGGSIYNHFANGNLILDVEISYGLNNNDRNIHQEIKNAINSISTNDFSNFSVAGYGSYAISNNISLTLGDKLIHQEYTSLFSGESSSKTRYKEWMHRPYFSAYYNYGRLFTRLSLEYHNDVEKIFVNGIRIKTTNSKINTLLPKLSLSYEINSKHNLNLNYTSSLDKPNYRFIVPEKVGSSLFMERQGNLELRPSRQSLWSLSYSFLKAATLEFSYSHKKHPFVELIRKDDAQYLMTMENLDTSNYLRLVFSFPLPIIYNESETTWTAYTNVAWQRQWDSGTLNENYNYKKVFNGFYIQHRHSLTIPNGWELDCQYVRYSSIYLGLYKTKPQWWMDFSIKKRIKYITMTLSVNDIFNSNIARVTFGPLLQDTYKINWQGPSVTFSVSYRFGKSLKKNRRIVYTGEGRLDKSEEDNITTAL